ncbi:MAG: hypothetical protein ABGX83_08015 [Nitrospira sp.]
MATRRKKSLRTRFRKKIQYIAERSFTAEAHERAINEIQSGFQELQMRENQRISKSSFCVSIISLVVAIGSLFVAYGALSVSSENRNTSKQWEAHQIKLLEKMDENNSRGNGDLIIAIGKMTKAIIHNKNSKEEIPQKKK